MTDQPTCNDTAVALTDQFIIGASALCALVGISVISVIGTLLGAMI